MELLKLLNLGDELSEQLAAALRTNKIYLTKLENADERYSKVKTQKEALETEKGELTSQLEEAVKSTDKVTELEGTIKKMKIDGELHKALSGVNPKYDKLIRGQIDMSKVEISETGVKGLEEQIKGLKEEYADFFKVDVKGKEPEKKTNPPAQTITKEQFNKMSYSERLELHNSNPELYINLTK